MKKIVALLLVGLLGTQTIAQAATVTPRTHTIVAKLNSYGKNASYIAAALTAAYPLTIMLNLIHEIGHATAGKLLYDAPFNISLGTHTSQEKNIINLGWLKINSLNPLKASARIINDPKKYHPLKEVVIALAGPIFGATASAIAYNLLKKYGPESPLSLCKSFAFSCILSNLLIENGLLSGLYPLAPKFFSLLGFSPNSDFNSAIRAIKEYRNS